MSLRSPQPGSSPEQFLKRMAPTQTFLNILLALIHPDLYTSASTIYEKCRSADDEHGVGAWSQQWRSKFGTVSLVVNRLSPVHRDGTSSDPSGLDFLISLGSTSGLTMNIPELGTHIAYGRGTVLAFSGHGFLHGVEGFDKSTEWRGGRMCYAQYMRKEVFAHYDQSISLAKLTSCSDGKFRLAYPA